MRKSLVESSPVATSAQEGGSTRKYILYAIGEIALVVIGILIALQINNWNEWRKERVREKVVLADVRDNLQRNSNQFSELLDSLQEFDQSTKIVFAVIENQIEYSDSLLLHFHRARIRGGIFVVISREGYESFKNTGFDIIQNEALKDEILKLYEVSYQSLQNVTSWNSQRIDSQDDYLTSHFIRGVGQELIPIDYDQVISDPYYYSLLKTIRGQRTFLISNVQEGLDNTKRVLQLIEDELGE